MNFPHWVVPFIVTDFALFPMFHTAGLPWKPGYLLLLFVSLYYTSVLSRASLMYLRPIIVIFTLLLSTVMVGSLTFESWTSAGFSTDTLRPLVIYILMPMAFIVGFGDRRQWHHYIFILVGVYFILNILHSMFASNLDWFADFYASKYLQPGELYGRGVRTPGILNNSNITALTATLLMIWLTVGIKARFIKPSAINYTFAITISCFTVIIMLSRNQMLAMIATSIVAFIYLPKRKSLQVILSSFTLALIGIFLIVSMGNDRQNDILGLQLTDTLERRLSSSGVDSRGFSDNLLSDQGIFRPLSQISSAIDRLSLSPIFGTGYESTIDIRSPHYHNDWATVLVTGGVIGLVVFLALFIYLIRLNPLLGLPLILPGLTNSILAAPQHLVLLMLLAGIIAGRRFAQRQDLNSTPPTVPPKAPFNPSGCNG